MDKDKKISIQQKIIDQLTKENEILKSKDVDIERQKSIEQYKLATERCDQIISELEKCKYEYESLIEELKDSQNKEKHKLRWFTKKKQ